MKFRRRPPPRAGGPLLVKEYSLVQKALFSSHGRKHHVSFWTVWKWELCYIAVRIKLWSCEIHSTDFALFVYLLYFIANSDFIFQLKNYLKKKFTQGFNRHHEGQQFEVSFDLFGKQIIRSYVLNKCGFH